MSLPKRGHKMSNDERIAILETTVGHVHETLERMEKNIEKGFSQVVSRLNNIETKIERVENRMDKINDRLWSNFIWIIGAIVAVCAVMAHGFHWF